MKPTQVTDPGHPRKFPWKILLLGVFVLGMVGVAGFFTVDRYTRENPSFCASCHNMKGHVETYQESNQMDHVHSLAGVGCKDCHAQYSVSDELTSVVKYVTGDYEETFSRRKYGDEMCLTCHISLQYQANRTDFLRRNPHLSHWPELRCGSCHISHGAQVDYCSRCHENGGQRMTGQAITPRTENPWTTKKP